jgi:hypothetical protein
MDFCEVREKYPKFIYNDYKIREEEDKLVIEYDFEIENLTKFNPRIEILKKNFKFNKINSNEVKNIVFNLGMVEAISYFKSTCSPQFFIKCGKLDDFQENWFKKLYYLGLGEFRFINNIKVEQNKLVEFTSIGEDIDVKPNENKFTGCVIPVGGGKDSNVTMNLLKKYKNDSLVFMIGGKKVSKDCAKVAGYAEEQIIEVKRIIDKNLLELNKKGFFNGHTPFSAIVAFISYLCSYMLEKKYIALSNEDSANETNVDGENINHQYSKTIEFENDFREYAKRYLKADIEYFSMLRPISELQIAMLFSRIEDFHPIFKSCNVGSKSEPWMWCCDCPKCLFVYTILSPFLYKEKLINIFGEDLFEKEKLLKTFVELCGYGETKPFECVGTYSEIRFAISKTIENLEKQDKKLPYLLEYYRNNFELSKENLLEFYNENNNLPEEFAEILKDKLLFE